MIRRFSVPAAILLCLSALLGASTVRAAEFVADRIVAVANGSIITDFDLKQQVKMAIEGGYANPGNAEEMHALRRQIIDQMIMDILLEQEAGRYGIKVSDADVRASINGIMEKTGMNEEQLRKELVVQGMSWEKFFENKRLEIKKRQLVSGLVKVVVSEDEVREAFEARHGKSAEGEYLHLRLIVLPEGMTAAAVRQEIDSGKLTFAKAASLYSQGPGAEHGGDLGVVARKDLAPDWRNALEGVAVGGVSKPFKAQGFDALLMIDSLAEAPQGDFEQEKENLYEDLYNKKMETFLKEYLDKLREKAVIEYRD
ncbi:SurA N-terminal domain-containing protein [Desulfovibrio aminophilus]|uniref:SurA N-terminal domain-containing protein n=1 Tax=Desulfovibrio aminophilus TaxID=81425 RepID=UPI0033980611